MYFIGMVLGFSAGVVLSFSEGVCDPFPWRCAAVVILAAAMLLGLWVVP